MHHSVAAIRHSRLLTRFAIHSAHRRERQLGLRRTSQLRLADAASQLKSSPPLAALRGAARSPSGLKGRPARQGNRRSQPAGGRLTLPRSQSISWSNRPATARRRGISRGRSATPWRG